MIELAPEAAQFELLKRLQKLRDECRKELARTPETETDRRTILTGTLGLLEAAFVSLRPIIDCPDFTPKGDDHAET